jgi:23S rRNA pseudouridine2457 synthase
VSSARRPPSTGEVIALHKPWGYLSQFTPDGSAHRPLAELGLPKGVFPVGRLDADSEGLLILSGDREVAARLLSDKERHPREYWVQVERVPDDEALGRLQRPLDIKGHRTLPCRAWRLDDPGLAERDPPVRFRKTVPTAWIAIELFEGKNRQVRRMTAAVGHPTLRLFRARVGGYAIGDLGRGEWRALDAHDITTLLAQPTRAA